VQGNPAQLTQVQWYRDGHHFATTISLKQLQQQQQSGSQVPPYYRTGTGKHFTLVDESTPIGPIDGAFLVPSNASNGKPFVQYLESPDILAITNVSRYHAGNYSCLGFNGAANSSQLSPSKSIEVKCKCFRYYK